MKKVMFSFALAFGFMAVTMNAQSLQTTGKHFAKADLSANRAAYISIWFGKSGCSPGFGICRIDIGRDAMSRLDNNQLKGTYTKNPDGTATLELDGNTNRAFVEKLLANGKMQLDQDYTFTAEESQKLFGTSQAMTLRNGGYDLKWPKKVDGANARMAGGTITIVIGKLVITIKW